MKRAKLLLILIFCLALILCACDFGGETHTHVVSNVWESDAQGHWNPCKTQGCDQRYNFAPHSKLATREEVIVIATDTTAGKKKIVEYCEVCNYQTSVTEVVVPALATHLATSDLASDEFGHWHKCLVQGCTEKFDFAPHNETTEETVLRQATCHQQGSKTVTVKCSDCNYVISVRTVVVPATGNHVADTVWHTDGTSHWHNCQTEGCTAKLDEQAHQRQTTEQQISAPTCYSNGSKTVSVTCSVCSKTLSLETQTIPATNNHVKAQNMSSNGTEHWYACTTDGCNYKFDSHTHNLTTTEQVTKQPTCYADGVKATITKCADCNYVTDMQNAVTIPATGQHVKTDGWQSNGVSHWHGCATKDCPYKFDEQSHQQNAQVVRVEPTCYQNGSVTSVTTCLVCQKVLQQSSEMLRATGEHVNSGQWTSDELTHWHGCTTDGCPYKFDEVAHGYDTFEHVDQTDTHLCKCVCQRYFTANCSGTTVGKDQDSHGKICSACNALFNKQPHDVSGGYGSDKDHVWQICSCGQVVNNRQFDHMHQVSKLPSNNLFYQGGATAYSYVFDSSNAKIATAVQYLSMYLGKALGSAPTSITSPSSVTWTETAKYVVLGDQRLFEQANLTMPKEILGNSGYYMATKGKSVFIMANDDTAYQHAILAFLREIINFDAYAPGCISYDVPENKTIYLPTLEVIEKPDFDFYLASNGATPWLDGYGSAYYTMGFKNSMLDLFINVTSQDQTFGPNSTLNTYDFNPFHNTLDFLPNKDYYQSHPLWYSDEWFWGGKEGSWRYEICFTAHGDANEYNLLVNQMASEMLKWIDANPDKHVIGLTVEDHETACSCSACMAMRNKYDGADSGALIKFVNDVNRIIQRTLQQRADHAGTEKRQIKIFTFAYHKMLQAPARQNPDGSWYPIDQDVVCDDEVCIFLAPIEMDFGKSVYDPINLPFKQAMDAWSNLTDTVYVWAYNTNFRNYLFPCSTTDDMVEYYRYFDSLGAEYLWAQGQHNASAFTGFSVLKDYVNSKAMFDLSVDTNKCIDDFFDNYFLDASASMKKYYQELKAYLRVLGDRTDVRATDNEYSVGIGKVTHVWLCDSRFWSKSQFDGWLQDINDAYDAIEQYKTTNPTLYNALKQRIKAESIFLRYALIQLYSSSFDANDLLQMKQQFKADCIELNFTQLGESKPIQEVWTAWGI